MANQAKRRNKPASIFLLVFAVVILLFAAATIAFNFYPWATMRLAYVPSHPLAEEQATPIADYTKADSWFAFKNKPAEAGMLPAGLAQKASIPEADVFFIHPTTYINSTRWNAPFDEEEVNYRTRFYVMKNLTTAFNAAGSIYAPKYRQATFGSFLDKSGDGRKAIMAAYGDVATAFETYMRDYNEGRPFILAGHSQGALHSMLLLANVISKSDYRDQLVAAYVIGWPFGRQSDLAAIDDISLCATASDTGCIISWQSFIGKDWGGAPEMMAALFMASPSLSESPRVAGEILCTNPLNWTIGGSAPAESNLGAVPAYESKEPLLGTIPDFTGASCNGDGYLILDRDPQEKPWSDKRLPGKNMHVHDVNLFYMNVRENAVRRVEAFMANRVAQ